MDRRKFLGTAGVALGAALAGCQSYTNSNTDPDTDGTSHTVSMEPMGEVGFDGVPDTWIANNGSYADMGLALGVEEPKALWLKGRWHTNYYDEIPDVSADKSDTISLYQDGVSKERFYSLEQEHGIDVQVFDPNFLVNRFGWKQADVDEIVNGVAPVIGNSIFSQTYPWHEDYRYYTLYEAFEKVAQVFQEQERYEAFASLHDDFQSNLDFVPTTDSERPRIAILWPASESSFYPYLVGGGTSHKQWRDLNVRDALAEANVQDFLSSRGTIDYETLLEVDPDALMIRGRESMTASEFQESVVAPMKEDNTASQLTAVQNGDVYRGGPLYQGPISNLVVTQRAAEQLYDVEEMLYDPQRVSDIVTGNA
ncbi:ABC transporter substrate-binding protein [Salarchaeum sp. JOR-1]|uniref:ABC transporter substrate-binding protein n=1 Tax=Salarchaeum sp. JOR-1 TaxID=2599399 RepID=UPI001198764A|nr:ABC transporter substrate-binding protein [Salarchaeum sp. JOR-1]QDX40047.1 ABC transporter substrate-binding protein [Salarchaeum sp. JOR-1]